jgi:hypothetical protein
VSHAQRQTFVDAPVEVVWELIRNVDRHPEWWPRVVEVHCDGMEEGCTYREVVESLIGTEEMNLSIEKLDDCRNLSIRCLSTGTYVQFLLTEAQDGTFVDGTMGMDPNGVGYRIFDAVMGQRYFRGWLQQTIEALDAAARRRARDLADEELSPPGTPRPS